jgi:hypothetical protein
MAAKLGLAQEVLALIASEPEALDQLRRIVGASLTGVPPAYTVATLAATLDVTEVHGHC